MSFLPQKAIRSEACVCVCVCVLTRVGVLFTILYMFILPPDLQNQKLSSGYNDTVLINFCISEVLRSPPSKMIAENPYLLVYS